MHFRGGSPYPFHANGLHAQCLALGVQVPHGVVSLGVLGHAEGLAGVMDLLLHCLAAVGCFL